MAMTASSVSPEAPSPGSFMDDLTPSDTALSADIDGPFIFTVSELSKSLDSILRSNFSSIWVTGELSALSVSARGHCYFQLKDEKASLNAVYFKPQAGELDLSAKLLNGSTVECLGTLTFYAGRGSCQLIIKELRTLGEGDLQAAFLAQRAALQQEGIFDETHKQTLPLSAQHIGIITSATGAVLKDILKTLAQLPAKRYGRFCLSLYVSSVQGADAAQNIVRQLTRAQTEQQADVLILARGGGSANELAAFNDERVVRSIFDCKIPVISAIGHESDWVLSDEVADLRAATPTAAAELLLKNRISWINAQHEQLQTLRSLLSTQLIKCHERLINAAPARLQSLLKTQLEIQLQKLQFLQRSARHALSLELSNRAQSLNTLRQLCTSLAPAAILRRGYAAVEQETQRVTRARALKAKPPITLTFADGSATVTLKSPAS